MQALAMTTIYHNPRCSKSRKTLELIRERGGEPTIVEYLSAPPSKEELRDLLQKLGLSPRELMRRRESVYQERNLDDPSLSDEELIDAMIEHPILIERPIVVTERGARICRPPEAVFEILG